jgi:methylenetetrahydrofolate reductase (NADPH)
LIASGALQEAGVKSVGLAGYPEPHPAITVEQMAEAHHKKRELAARLGLSTFTMTQFSFSPESLVDLLRARRATGETDTIRLGIAGPASIAALLKFAAICGVQTSARALTKQGGKIARMLVESGPEPLLRGVCEADDYEQLGAIGIHIFPFGGFGRSAEWLATVAASGDGAVAQAS